MPGHPATILVPMPFPALNANAVIQCPHMGKVNVIPKLPTVTIGGAPALRLTDLMGSPIHLCGAAVAVLQAVHHRRRAAASVGIEDRDGRRAAAAYADARAERHDGRRPAVEAGLICSFSGAPTVMVGS